MGAGVGLGCGGRSRSWGRLDLLEVPPRILFDVDEVGCGLGECGFVVEVDGEVDAFVVVGVEDDGVGFYEGVSVVGVFMSQDEEVDSPAFGEVFELFVVVASSPGEEVRGSDSWFVVLLGEVAGEDGGVEAVHHAWAWEGVGAEDVSLRALGAEGDGHREDELFDGITDRVGVDWVGELLIDPGVEGFDAADAVLDDEGVDCLGEFVVGEEEVDELGVLGFEFGYSGESLVGGVHGGGLAGEGLLHVGVDDFVEGEVLGFGAELAVESCGGDDGAEVLWVVVGVTGGDEVTWGFDEVDGSLAAACGAVGLSALSEGLGNFFRAGHIDGVHQVLSGSHEGIGRIRRIALFGRGGDFGIFSGLRRVRLRRR